MIFCNKRNISLITAFFIFFSIQAQHKSKLSIGFGVSHLYDLYEGESFSNSGNTPYTDSDIDLKGLNGDFTKFDLCYGVLGELELEKGKSVTFSYHYGKMTSQLENQYSTSTLNMLNIGLRQYFFQDKNKSSFSISPYGELDLGITNYSAERMFVDDQSLFSQTSGFTLSSSLSVGCRFNVLPRLQVTAAPNFIINFSDAIDGYKYKSSGSDMMLRSTIGILYSLSGDSEK